MKKIFTALLMVIAAAPMQAQIFNNPTGISPTTGPQSPRDVGIGTSQPRAGLHIVGGINTGTTPSLVLQRADNPLTNQDNRLTVGISSSNFTSVATGGGTCAFMLDNPYQISDMAFSTNRTAPQLIIKPSGNIGINTVNPTHKLQVHDGALMLSGAVPGFGGPQLLFTDDLNSHPNGRWGLEYMTAGINNPSMGGMNFWQPWPNAGSAGNYSWFLKDDGKIGMGVTDDNGDANYTANPFAGSYRLYVHGGILTDKVKVAVYGSAQWADYVFAKDYQLKPLSEVESFVKTNKHLPGVPSAEELVKTGGIDVQQMFAKHMEKIEELTLYIIGLQKEIELLKKATPATGVNNLSQTSN
jgi:hypothetical protein